MTSDQAPESVVVPDPQADDALRALFLQADAASPLEAVVRSDAAWTAQVMAQVAAEAAARQRRQDLIWRAGGAVTALCLAAALPFAPPALANLAAGLSAQTGLSAPVPQSATLLPALSIATAAACLAALAILTRPATTR